MKKINVTIYTTSDFPYGSAPENLVRNMALGLNAEGIKVNVLCVKGSYYRQYNDTNIKKNFLIFKKRFKNDFFKFFEIIIIILIIPFSIIRNKIRNKTNIVILYGLEYFYFNIQFYIFCKLFKIKLYRIVTDLYPSSTIAPVWWKSPKKLFLKLQQNYLDKKLNGIICLSYYLKNYFVFRGVKNIVVIPHFIDINFFINNSGKQKPFSKKSITIGFCGSLNRQNGLHVLIKAYKKLKENYNNLNLLLIGSIENNDLYFIKNYLGDDFNTVELTGKVHTTEVSKLLSQCDILVNPRLSGVFAEAGFPTKLGEYLATKRPVVTTAVGDIKLYFNDKQNIVLVKPNSYLDLTKGIEFLLENESLALEVGYNGYLWAKENLDYRINARKLLKFIL